MGQGHSTLRRVHTRLPRRLRDHDLGSDEAPQEIVVQNGPDVVARGLGALALIAVLALLMIGVQRQHEVEPLATTPQHLQQIRKLGTGLTTLMIEEFHREAWARYHFSLDTAQSVENLQLIADQLELPYQIKDVVGNRRLRAFVSTGGALPVPLADEIAHMYGSHARDVFELSCLLSWISLEGAVVPNYFGEMQNQLQDSYLASYTKTARRINLLLERCGVSGFLPDEYPGDPNEVMELCLELGEDLNRKIKVSG